MSVEEKLREASIALAKAEAVHEESESAWLSAAERYENRMAAIRARLLYVVARDEFMEQRTSSLVASGDAENVPALLDGAL